MSILQVTIGSFRMGCADLESNNKNKQQGSSKIDLKKRNKF